MTSNNQTMYKKQTILIQLIGNQTIPNIQAVHILKPDKVYNLCTKTTLEQGQKVEKWIQKRYSKEIASELKILSEQDLYCATRKQCEALKESHQEASLIYNVTGGTKLMSLAMYQSAEGLENASIIYVNAAPQGELIYLLQTAEGEEERQWQPRKGDGLGILDILEVGEQAVEYKSLKDWRPCVPAARTIMKLADSMTADGVNSQDPSSHVNRQLLARLRKAALNNSDLAASFASAGCKFTANRTGEKFNLAFLTGMWWEIVVADYLERSGKYTEVMCSVQTWISQECGLTDVDVLATDGRTLTCYSCKKQLKQPDSEINKHKSRSLMLGGIKAISGLAVYRGNENSYTKLQQLTKAAKIECLTGPMVWDQEPHYDYGNGKTALNEVLVPGRGLTVESFLG